MKRMVATALGALLFPAAAVAQSYPDSSGGAGHQLGIQQVNNSGQVGTVTTFDRGGKTLVVVSLRQTAGRDQSVRIYRGHDCDTDIASSPQYFLNDMRHGTSVSTVAAPSTRLLSGNYNVLVFSSTQKGARAVACGHLY